MLIIYYQFMKKLYSMILNHIDDERCFSNPANI